MKILTRYLFKEILHCFILFISILLVILLVNIVYDMREDFLKNHPPIFYVVMYFIYGIPSLLSQALPIICLMSTIFSYGLLAKNREILAMVASGISFGRLAVPALVFGVVLTGFMFWFNEYIVPTCQSRAHYIDVVYINGKSESVLTKRKNLFVKGGGNLFYFMENFDSNTREMAFPTIMKLSEDGGNIVERVEADAGKLLASEQGKKLWQFTGAEHWTFKPNGGLNSYEKIKGPYQMTLEGGLDRFLSKSKKPEEMNFQELRDYVSLLEQKGDKNTQRFSTSLEQKLAFPVSCLLMALLGFAVVVDVHARRFARGVFSGLLIAVGFYLVNALLTSAGQRGTVAPLVAGWLPVMVFIGIVYLLMIRLRKIRG